MCSTCVHYAPWGAVRTRCDWPVTHRTRLTDDAARVTCPDCLRASEARNRA